MVGPDEMRGDQRQDVPCLCRASHGPGVRSTRTLFYERIDKILASGTWTPKDCPDCRVAAETIGEAKLFVAIGSGRFPKGCPPNTASCPFLYRWLVHRIEAGRDLGPEV